MFKLFKLSKCSLFLSACKVRNDEYTSFSTLQPDFQLVQPKSLSKNHCEEQSKLNEIHLTKNKSIITFKNLRSDVLNELKNGNEIAGLKWKRFPGLNKILKGHRDGELTIFTGSTGCGKTTFLSEFSLDLCMQGLPTLWGNFEIKNIRLSKKMLNQFAQKSLEDNLQEFDYWADQFEKMPLYFLTFHGEESFENVLDSMSFAVKELNIKHIIIDNLQFMMGNQCETSKLENSKRIKSPFKILDKFGYQDLVIGACRKFATINNCHITLVVHPRKEPNNNEDLTNNSIFGGGKASQEADNILILQVKWTGKFRFQKYLQVSKNRYDGDLGMIPLTFNKDTNGFGIKNVEMKLNKEKNQKKFNSK